VRARWCCEHSANQNSSDIIKIILAILLPPLGVFLERGCGADLLINIILTCLGYIPGIIHALYVLPCSASFVEALRARVSARLAFDETAMAHIR
jgi:uncharacterized membrane protein YqaE (UPF0057 family)